MKLALYWSYATRSLLRGGQRTVLAMFCVAVGVMAIVALQLVGLSVQQALVGNVVAANGGDIRLNASLVPLRPGDIAYIDKLRQQGLISAYATSYTSAGSVTLPSGDLVNFDLVAVSANFPLVGQPHFIAPSSSLSVQSIVREHAVAMSAHVFQALHAHIGSKYQVKLLDGHIIPVIVAAEFQESGAYNGSQVLISQTAIEEMYGVKGVDALGAYDTVYITVSAAHFQGVKNQLAQHFQGVQVITAQDLLKQRQQQVQQIQLFLRIIGLLALFIGGIGIINTMQVLLRRRQVEIAMLKTTGYRRGDLYALFGLEAALLGIVGGVVGTGSGVAASYVVGAVVGQAFQLSLPIVLDATTIGSGLLIGLATTLIFGLLPIVQASQVRPLVVLRESHEGMRASSRLVTLLLLLLLSVLFVILAAIILQNVQTALLVVYGGALAIVILALGLSLLILAISKLPVYERPQPRMLYWLLVALAAIVLAALAFVGLSWLGNFIRGVAADYGQDTLGLCALIALGGLGIMLLASALVYGLATLVNCLAMFLPRGWKTPVMLAYRNLGRQRVRSTTTLTALFVGVFAIGLVLVLGQGVENTITSTLNQLFTRNVFVVVQPAQVQRVQEQLSHVSGIDTNKTIVNPVVQQIYPLFVAGKDINTVLQSIDSHSLLTKSAVLSDMSDIEGFALAQGKNNIPDLVMSNGRNLRTSDAGTNNVVMNARLELYPLNLRVGDTLIVQSADGKITRQLTIVGFYDSSDPTKNFNFAAILADQQVTQQLGDGHVLDVFSLKVNPDQIPTLKRQVNKAVPGAFVISVVDIAGIIDQILANVIVMLTTLASLALIAGFVIIANAVALAMLERQREIGILKALGYTSRSVLATVLIEHGLLGLLGALVAMLLVTSAVTALSRFVFQLQLGVSAWLLVLMVAATALLTMLMALLVSWQAVHVRPLEVLRYE